MSTPQFSKRHYETIADVLAGLPTNREGYAEHGDVVAALADAFEADNPRFDRDRFFKASQPTQPTEQSEQSDCEQAGWLLASRHVVCAECLDGYDRFAPVPLYHVNIDRYSQHCHQCQTLIHNPQSDAWPELFSPRDCGVCSGASKS